MWSCSINCPSTTPRSRLLFPAQKYHLIGQCGEVRVLQNAPTRFQPADKAAGRKSLPDGVVIEMEDPRCKIAAIEAEDPRCKGMVRGVVIEMEVPRCKGLLQGVAI